MVYLVVEGSLTVRESICYLLLAFGVRGVPVANRKAAREALARGDAIDGAIIDIDNKEVELLRKFLTASSKMMSRKRGGTSSTEQRDVRRAIKRARFLALLPYVGI